jgi:Domain of Unknown Function (DUF1080)
MRTAILFAALCFLTVPLFAQDAAPPPRKVEKPINFVLLKPDPLIGDWQGTGGIVAQVYKTPKGEYQANLFKAFDSADAPISVLSGEVTPDGINFTGDGWTAAIQKSDFTGSKGGASFDLQRITRTSPTLGEKPPAGAVVLFDGTNLDAWAKKAGKQWLVEDGPARWKLVDDAMEIVPGSDCVITHQKFGDCRLHVEFRTICYPSKSAVFLETRYEVNINETYGKLDGAQAGGLDNTTSAEAPRVRPCFPPLAWQTFDIDFHAPRFDAGGKKTLAPNMTVQLNGVTLYDHVDLNVPHGAAGRLGEAPTGPLMLQDHTTPLQYRNIWLVETHG